MPIRYGRFEMPKTLAKDEGTATDTYAKFTAEPFEAGYGHTVGNSLRRVLLSSLEGAAITAANITGAQHGVDVTDALLDTGFAAVLPASRILGGKGSFADVSNMIEGKLKGGTIRDISTRTLGKILTVKTIEEIGSLSKLKDVLSDSIDHYVKEPTRELGKGLAKKVTDEAAQDRKITIDEAKYYSQ